MFWNILLAFALWAVSCFWTSYSVVMPLVVIRVGFPLVRALEEKGLIDAKPARRAYRFSLLIMCVVDFVVIMLMVYFANSWAWTGFLIGFGIVALLGIAKTGVNDTTRLDFILSQIKSGRITSENKERAAVVVKYYPEGLSDSEIDELIGALPHADMNLWIQIHKV